MPERKKVKYRRIVKSAKAKVFKTNWQEQDFFKHCEIDSDLVEKSKITWEELSVIHDISLCQNQTVKYCRKLHRRPFARNPSNS